MVRIREAMDSELSFIRRQRIEAYEEHAAALPRAHWDALKGAISTDADIQEGAAILVAEAENRIVGSVVLFAGNVDAYGGLTDASDAPEIRMLAVSSSERGQGIAAALVKECARRAAEMGAIHVGLHTADFMHSAVRLYERLGFERVPSQDFIPANDGIVVKGYRLALG